MSTATQEAPCPEPTSYEVNLPSWRIAEGFFKKGQDDTPGFQKTEKVFGKFNACGISTYADRTTGEDIERLWVELENRDDGKFRVTIKTRSAVGAALLGRAILESNVGEWLGLKAVPSEDPKKKSTRVFADRYNGTAWVPVKLVKDFPGADSAGKLPGILNALRQHPGFRAQKPKEAIDYNTAEQWECFAHESEKAGWPAFGPNKAAYMEWAGQKGIEPQNAPDELWIDLRKKVGDGVKAPKKLMDLIAANPPKADEYDPFAEE